MVERREITPEEGFQRIRTLQSDKAEARLKTVYYHGVWKNTDPHGITGRTISGNVLVFDEPTNDLDIETLEILESILVSFSGTILMVSHDRSFLNNVITSLIVVEGTGSVYEFFGDYDLFAAKKKKEEQKNQIKENKPLKNQKEKIKKLTLTQQKELEELPQKIEEKEILIESIYHRMSDPVYFKNSQTTIKENNDKLEKLKNSLDEDYQRWETLEEIHQNFIMSKKR